LVPFFSLLTTDFLILIETAVRYLLMGILVYIFWNMFKE
jgi:hypothetical protein